MPVLICSIQFIERKKNNTQNQRFQLRKKNIYPELMALDARILCANKMFYICTPAWKFVKLVQLMKKKRWRRKHTSRRKEVKKNFISGESYDALLCTHKKLHSGISFISIESRNPIANFNYRAPTNRFHFVAQCSS